MRHRASRPLADFLQRLPRAAAHRLERAAERVPVRALAALTVAVGLGTGGYVALAPLVDGASSGDTETAIDTSSPASDRPDLTTQTPSSDDPKPDESSPEPSRAAAGQPQAPPSTRDVPEITPTEPDETTESPSTEPPPTSSSPSQSDEAASRTPKGDTTPPNTSLSEEFPERDSAVFTLSANEDASFACSLDASYSGLDSGWHTFGVRATDDAGNVDPSPAETRWHSKGGHSEDE
jgi:hypothetical protein